MYYSVYDVAIYLHGRDDFEVISIEEPEESGLEFDSLFVNDSFGVEYRIEVRKMGLLITSDVLSRVWTEEVLTVEEIPDVIESIYYHIKREECYE